VLECRRATRRFPAELVESLALSFTPAQPEDDHLQAVLACLEKLPTRARAIMQMRYLSEQSPAEIARQLNRSANGVRVALAKARDMLRACVGKRLGIPFSVSGGNA
jgi:RNA polymerase sigma factor (sigma-70 family)